MADSEKITINLGSIDLGKIDLLVEEGFYSNRADFIRMAIRLLLDSQQEVVKQATMRRSSVLGVLVYDRADLEKKKAKGETLDIRIIGMLVLGEDIPGELAREVIERVQVFGSLKASAEVRDTLGDRIVQGR